MVSFTGLRILDWFLSRASFFLSFLFLYKYFIECMCCLKVRRFVYANCAFFYFPDYLSAYASVCCVGRLLDCCTGDGHSPFNEIICLYLFIHLFLRVMFSFCVFENASGSLDTFTLYNCSLLLLLLLLLLLSSSSSLSSSLLPVT